MTAASALALGFSTLAFAGNGNGNHSHNFDLDISHSFNGNNINSSKFNIGGQNNGSHSVSGVLNDQNQTGNFSTQNNNAPAVVVVF
jgi:hypothetical protein